MNLPRPKAFLAVPLAAIACGVLAWSRHPMTIRQIVSWLVQNPVWCVVIGMGIGLLLIVTLIAGFTFEEKLNGGQPESENSVANQIARGLQRDLNGPPWWWRW